MGKVKSGIASFYIVAFSTLILTVIAVSFAAVMVSQILKTSNDDLAQSAYDSAMAGVEDAKLAYYNYQRCLESGIDVNGVTKPADEDRTVNCNNIVYWMKNPSCDMVAKILGRAQDSETGDVLIQESSSNGSSMQQAYTCVKINTEMTDYRSSLNSDNATRVVRVKVDNAAAIKTVRISWYKEGDNNQLAWTNFLETGNKVVFPYLGGTKAATPPTISVGLVQTAKVFGVEDFEITNGVRTNRGTVFLVPSNDEDGAKNGSLDMNNYIGVYNGNDNVVTAAQIVKSNDHTLKNLPYAVYCGNGKEFVCSATLQLPDPIDGERSDDTFNFVISIPYGQPSTDFALEFCKSDTECDSVAVGGNAGGADSEPVDLSNMQVEIDSTGRANNLYRRVSVRMDSEDTYFPYPLYALELLKGDGNYALDKDMTVTSEYGL